MINTKWFTIIGAFLVLAGCSYKAEVLETPSFNVASSFGSQIPGLWFLYVDGTALDRPVKTSTMACAAHKFPIVVAGPFATSVKETLENVIDQIEVVPGPVDRSMLQSRHARGIIIVRGDELRPHMEIKPGFLSASMETQATVIATVTVDGVQGRLLGSTVEGQGFASGDAGFACGGGAKALGDAVGQGMGDVMRKLGEAVSNSERIRTAAN